MPQCGWDYVEKQWDSSAVTYGLLLLGFKIRSTDYVLCSNGPCIFQKYRSHLKILGRKTVWPEESSIL